MKQMHYKIIYTIFKIRVTSTRTSCELPLLENRTNKFSITININIIYFQSLVLLANKFINKFPLYNVKNLYSTLSLSITI